MSDKPRLGYICLGKREHEIASPNPINRCPAGPCGARLKAVGAGSVAENERLAEKYAADDRLAARLSKEN
jgi:hypothetical protein